MRTMRRVYPRACGGTKLPPGMRGPVIGLSPRVRGNRRRRRVEAAQHRSIPARAGEPPRRFPHRPYDQVYPRACGGTEVRVYSLNGTKGLSPRVRGNPPPHIELPPDTWSIPARAGEPALIASLVCIHRVYPRACGGTCAATISPCPPRGLSPRVRGNLSAQSRRRLGIGSIPARAGEPAAAAFPPCCAGVYPRACGGTSRPFGQAPANTGLSPRVRGNHPGADPQRNRAGSIPARAGEPIRRTAANAVDGVYPRACGGTE